MSTQKGPGLRSCLSPGPLVVELPGIEPELLAGKMACGLPFRYISFPFSAARYLRFRFRVLTASRVIKSFRATGAHFSLERFW